MADDVHLAGVVVEAEDQRSDRVGFLARAVAGHDGVDRAHPLDLHHAGALAWLVLSSDVLGHDALAAAQPWLGLVGVPRQRGAIDPGRAERLEPRAPLGERTGQPRATVQ